MVFRPEGEVELREIGEIGTVGSERLLLEKEEEGGYIEVRVLSWISI